MLFHEIDKWHMLLMSDSIRGYLGFGPRNQRRPGEGGEM